MADHQPVESRPDLLDVFGVAYGDNLAFREVNPENAADRRIVIPLNAYGSGDIHIIAAG